MKYLVCFIITISLSLGIAGCQRYKPLSALEVNAFDSASEANHVEEYKIGTEKKEKKSMEGKTAEIEWDGRKITGIYSDSTFSELYSSETDEYIENKGNNPGAVFALDVKSGRVAYLWTSLVPPDDTKEKTETECYSVAQEYLKKIVDDYDQYQLFDTREADYEDYHHYSFGFSRKIGGVITIDKIFIDINSDGTFHSFVTFGLGTMKGVKLPKAYNESKIESAINEKLEKIYGNLKETHEMTYEIRTETAVLMPLKDGTYGIKYAIVANLQAKDNSGDKRDELTEIIVCLGK